MSILAATDKVVMSRGGVGDHQETHHDAADPVEPEPDVVLGGPGDHDDGGLQHQLQCRLGQHTETVEDSRPREVLKLQEVFLSFVQLVGMPHDERYREQQRAKQQSPE